MERRLLLVAGGTGGHIWPAISFGKWAHEVKNDVQIYYVCGSRELEEEIYSAAELKPFVINLEGSPFSGGISIGRRFRRIGAIFSAFRGAGKLIKKLRPDCCVLFGGYLSLPFLLRCRMMKVPVVVHEQNAVAGRVTKIAARLGAEIISGWNKCAPLSADKYSRTGTPVRNFEKFSPEAAWKKLRLEGEMPKGIKVVALSGSLGSGTVKEAICSLAQRDSFKEWTFFAAAVAEKPRKERENVWSLPKMWDPAALFRIADIVVVRGGGSTLTEIASMGIVPLIVPWRGAANDHQYENAISFLSENEGLMLESENDLDLFMKKLLFLGDSVSGARSELASRMYNSPDKINEAVWLAIASQF